MGAWVAFTATLFTIVGSVKEYLKLQELLTSTNAGVRDLKNTAIWWDSLSVVERRTRESRTRAVSVTEQALLDVVRAWTATSARVGSSEEGKGDGDDGGKGG